MPNKKNDGTQPTKQQLKEFLRRWDDGDFTFVQIRAILENRVRYPISTINRDFTSALTLAEAQALKLFGYKANISEMFALPRTLPWKRVMAILVPPGVDNRKAVDSLAIYKIAKWEETDVNNYSSHEASDKPRLFLMEYSSRPTKNTIGMSPDVLVKSGRFWLPLKAYALAFGQYHESTKRYLDERTWTWFPTERSSIARVARGGLLPDDHGFRFYCGCIASCDDNNVGGREAIEVLQLVSKP